MKRFILFRSIRIFRHKKRSFSTRSPKLLTNHAIPFSKQMILNLNYNANLARCFPCSAKLNSDGNDVNVEIFSPEVEAFNKLLCCEREIVQRKFDQARRGKKHPKKRVIWSYASFESMATDFHCLYTGYFSYKFIEFILPFCSLWFLKSRKNFG